MRVKSLKDKIIIITNFIGLDRVRVYISPPKATIYFSNKSPNKCATDMSDTTLVASSKFEDSSMLSASMNKTTMSNCLDKSAFTNMSSGSTVMTRSIFATAGLGYANKRSIEVAAMASTLIACVRYYTVKTGAPNLYIEEAKIMKMWTAFVGPLYGCMNRDVPAGLAGERSGLPLSASSIFEYLRVQPLDLQNTSDTAVAPARRVLVGRKHVSY